MGPDEDRTRPFDDGDDTMPARPARKLVRTLIAERFPVFYSHANQTCRLANDPRTEGPFYAENSEWLDVYSDFNLAFRRRAAETLRKDGYTVTVDVVER